MELHYFKHVLPGSPFYEDAYRDQAGRFRQADAPWPDEWCTRSDAEWFFAAPRSAVIRDQGWKVHVSATLENSQRVLDVVSAWCLAHRVPFKFIQSPTTLLQRNSKYGDRGASGKFVTIYPRDDEHLEEVVRALDDALEGAAGPYILSDLRWNRGPLFVRYGAFVHRVAPDAQGRLVPCIEDPDGNLVPDERRPAFRPPSWAPLPDFLEPAVQARAAGILSDFPYRVTAALHHSNGGGVYLAVDTRSGATVVVKEARPYAGLDEGGADAVARLEIERAALEHLDGVPGVPTLLDYRRGHEHYFLVREHVEGESLSRVIATQNPLMSGSTDPEDRTRWSDLASGVLAQVSSTLEAMHERGLVFGDVHPNNVIVDGDGTVGFIDFECVTACADDLPQRLGAPGYRAPVGTTGTAVDHYGLACLQLGVFVPQTVTVPWGRDKARMIRDRAVRDFTLPPDFAEDAIDLLDRTPHEGTVDVDPATEADFTRRVAWVTARTSLHGGLLAAEVDGPRDRVFPGDVQQFLVPGGGIVLATGTAGVLWASRAGDLPISTKHVDALAGRVEDDLDLGAGLWDGWAGVAHVLRRLGRTDPADAALRRALAAPELGAGSGYFRGRSGLALALAESDDADLLGAGFRIADELATVRHDEIVQASRSPGLLYGASGAALLEMRLHDVDPRDSRLERALGYLQLDHDAALAMSRSAVPWFLPPPLVAGGLGVGLVLREYLLRRPDPAVRDLLVAALGTARVRAFEQPGLLRGHAAIVLALAALRPHVDTLDHEMADHLRALPLFSASHAAGPAVLGDHGLRLSTDLATGTAGVVHAVDVAHGLRREVLPFLTSAVPPR